MRYELLPTIVLVCAYGAIFAVGAIGNILVVLIVSRSRRMRTVTNIFLVNLAIADLFVILFCVPFTATGHILKGSFICKTVAYIQGVSVAVSVHTLVAISLERCIAVIWPLCNYFRKRHAFCVIFLLWTISISMTLPYALFFKIVREEKEEDALVECREEWPSQESENLYFLIVHLSICYILPMLIIGVCYTFIGTVICRRRTLGETSNGSSINQSKLKAAKMIFTVILAFALSWLPLYTMATSFKFKLIDLHQYFGDYLGYAFAFVQWLSSANSCINPLLYHYMDKKFRLAFKQYFCPAEEMMYSRTSSKRLSLTQARAHIPCSRQTSLLSMNGNAAHRYYRSTKLPSLSEKSDKTEILSLTVSFITSPTSRHRSRVSRDETHLVTEL
ncbi:neuropeptide SIFamide receptor-like isoform X2 [Artemia franciscana]|uniref:neuropeptide SIFamide receptor-like isoform X2 n=1 Tax=Artemia franciscana TaxID=6661 RepID=UPI0032D9D204